MAELSAYGALPAALAGTTDRSRRLAVLEARSATVAAVVGGIAATVPAVLAVCVALLAGHGAGTATGAAPAVLALVALSVGEVVVPLAAAAVRQAELRGGLRRVRELIAGPTNIGTAPPAPPTPAMPTPAPPTLGPPAMPPAAPPFTGNGAMPSTRNGATPVTGPGAMPAPGPVSGPVELVLRGVTVRYRDDLPPVLFDVDLALPAGSRVAVVGPSGSGKSTLLAAIAGRVPLAAGAVDGMPVGAEAWQVAGGVFADAHVFHATVRDNLLLGRDTEEHHGPGAGTREAFTDAGLRRVLVDAGLPEYADRLDDLVGEDGGQLSGGQRQRLLLARALVVAPPVLLLDEPTEGVDADAADAVLETVLRAAGGRTVVVVTHRQAELARFDRVVRVVDGRVHG